MRRFWKASSLNTIGIGPNLKNAVGGGGGTARRGMVLPVCCSASSSAKVRAERCNNDLGLRGPCVD